MKTIVRLIVFLLLIVGWGLAALSLHVVRTSDQIPITLVTKEQFGIIDTYVDTRTWTLDDVARHEALVQKLIRDGRADVLRHVVEGANNRKSSDVATQLSDALRRSGRRDETSRAASTSTEQAARGLIAWLMG